MTYAESNALMTDIEFRGRIKVACLNYANFILTGATVGTMPRKVQPPVGAPGSNSFNRWARECFINPDMTAVQVQPPTVMEPSVQAAGAATSDADLQTAVENVVNTIV
jgi:hypothetical protein